MQNVANVSFLAMFIMYLLAALFGYLTFNSESPCYVSAGKAEALQLFSSHVLFPNTTLM